MEWYNWLIYFIVLSFIYLLFRWLDLKGDEALDVSVQDTIKAFEDRKNYLNIFEKIELKRLKKLRRWWKK